MSNYESKRPTLFLISGPWGSGTSALAGCLYHLGLPIPSPFYISNDDRTLNTFESECMRSILLLLCKEEYLKKINNEKLIVKKIKEQKLKILSSFDKSIDSFGLKIPISAIFIKEFSKVFDLRLIISLRPYRDIEKSRERRNWPKVYGKEGAKIIYKSIFDEIINTKLPYNLIRYSDLIQPKTNLEVINQLKDFCDLDPTDEEISKAKKFLNRE